MIEGAWPPAAVTALLTSDPRFDRVPADLEYARSVVNALVVEECELAQDNVRIVNRVRELLDLPARPDVVPTEENIAAFGRR